MANVICLGALQKATGVLPLGDVESALEKHLPEHYRSMLEVNLKALKIGYEAADGEAEVAAISEQTTIEEERFLRRVDEEISRREAETRDRLAQDTAELTALLARDLLEKEMTDEDRRRVFERSLEAMTTIRGKE